MRAFEQHVLALINGNCVKLGRLVLGACQHISKEGEELGKFRNFGWLSADDFVRVLLSFALMALIARYLGPRGFGALSYIFSIVGLLSPLTSFGLDVITLRRLVSDPADEGRTLGTAMTIRGAGATMALAAAIGFIFAFGGPDGVTLGLAAFAALVLPFQSTAALDTYLKAKEKMTWIAAPKMVVRGIMAVATIGVVVGGGTLSSFVALRVLQAALIALAAVGAYAVVSGRIRLTVDAAQIRSMLGEGMPLFLSSIAIIVYMRIDQVMLGQLASGEALGQYSVAVSVSECVFFIPMVLQAVFYPSLVRAWTTASETWHDELQHYYDVAALTMLALTLAVTGFATVGVTPLLGSSYKSAIPMIWILALSIPFVGLGVARTTYLTIQGWLWSAPLAAVLGTLVNVGLNFYLIPAWGGSGAAVATVVSYWLAAHGTCLLFPWLRPVGRQLTKALNPIGAAQRSYAIWQAQQQME